MAKRRTMRRENPPKASETAVRAIPEAFPMAFEQTSRTKMTR